MKEHDYPPRIISHLALGVVCALASVVAGAQTVSAGDPAPSGETIQLSPFTVSSDQDVGYVATSSLAGSRLNTALQDTAASVSVMTKEMLEDLGANNFQDAAEWSVSAVSRYYDEASPYGDSGVNFRGLAGGYNSRNYFRWYVNSDAFLTERYDLARGPNSMVFGDSGIGGMINVSSKRANGRRAGEFQVRYRAYENGQDGLRFGIDYNQPISNKLEVRGVYVKQRFADWMDRTSTSLESALLTFNYRPFRSTTIWGEFEYGHQIRIVAPRVFENYSRWDGTTSVTAPITTGNFPNGLGRQTSDHFVFVPGMPSLGLQNWRNWGTSGGTGIQLRPAPWDNPPIAGNPTIPSYAYNFQAPNADAHNLYKSHSLFLEQRFGEHFWAEAAVNYYDQKRDATNAFFNTGSIVVDVNRNLPNGGVNPFYGQKYVDTQISPEFQTHEQWEFRANLAYLQKFSFVDLRALLGATRRDDNYDINRMRWVLQPTAASPSVNASINQLWLRRYETQLDQPFMFPANAIYIQRDATQNTRKGWNSQQAVVNGSWFQSRRLKTMVGYRRDNITDKQSAVLVDPVSQQFIGFGPRTKKLDVNVDNWSGSALYQWTRWLRTYASYGESYDFTSSATSINGGSIPPLISSGVEAGLRINAFGDKVAATVAYYESKQINRRESGSEAQIDAIWLDLAGIVDSVPTYSDTSSWRGHGLEFEVVANPTRSFRFAANLSLPTAIQKDGYAYTKAYYAANLPKWQQLLAATTDTVIINRVNSNISTIKNRIEGFAENRKLNGNFDYTANIMGTYNVREGRLKGLVFGGGAQFRGERLIGNYLGSAYDYIYSGPYWTASAWLGYSTKIGGHTVRWHLNVNNLFDERAEQGTSGGFANVAVNGVTTFRGTKYTVLPPRTYQLTMSTRF